MTPPETSPRQVLYALVAAGLVIVVVILTIGGAAAGLVPTWWSGLLAISIVLVGIWIARNWRHTKVVLALAIGLFSMWMIGTLILAT
jgi:hypothetical protein